MLSASALALCTLLLFPVAVKQKAMEITASSVVVATPAQVSCAIGTETVILHVEKGSYYGLDEVGTAVWNRIQQPARVSEIRDAILQDYNVSLEQCERDLLAVLQKLSEQGLIEVRRHAANS